MLQIVPQYLDIECHLYIFSTFDFSLWLGIWYFNLSQFCMFSIGAATFPGSLITCTSSTRVIIISRVAQAAFALTVN